MGGYLHIDSNNGLTSLQGLSALRTVGADLSIYSNPQLRCLKALSPALQTVVGNVNIHTNPRLMMCKVLAEHIKSAAAGRTGTLDYVERDTCTHPCE